jgi:hypothetical protein
MLSNYQMPFDEAAYRSVPEAATGRHCQSLRERPGLVLTMEQWPETTHLIAIFECSRNHPPRCSHQLSFNLELEHPPPATGGFRDLGHSSTTTCFDIKTPSTHHLHPIPSSSKPCQSWSRGVLGIYSWPAFSYRRRWSKIRREDLGGTREPVSSLMTCYKSWDRERTSLSSLILYLLIKINKYLNLNSDQ